MTTLPITMLLSDHNLLGRWFDGKSWDAWRVVLKAAFGMPLKGAERILFRALANRAPPTRPVRELWVIGGRRSGKDSIASALACYFAAFHDYSAQLRPGERAVVMCLACDRQQAQLVMRYIRGYFTGNKLLAPLVERETANGLELTTGAEIVIATNDYRAVRGRTVVLAILDEVAYYRDERSTSPDVEVYNALTPSLATLPNAMLIGISTPYRRAGLLHDKFRKHYGQNDPDVLVIRAPSKALNPTLDQRIIDAALEADPQAAAAEWLAEFRSDIDTFVSREVVDSCTMPGMHERLAESRFTYSAFVDPAGGSGGDSFTLAIAHRVDDIGVLDCIRERRPPLSPESVVKEFADVLQHYGVREVQGDKYGGDWPAERFQSHGIRYLPVDYTKSQIYVETLPLLNSGKLELLDHQRLATQLSSLERRTARGGRDSIDHPPGAHDDVANAAAGVLVKVAGKLDPMLVWRKLATVNVDALYG